MNFQNSKAKKMVSMGMSVGLMALLSGCGKSNGNVSIQSNPLAGPSAASLGGSSFNLASLSRGLFDTLFGVNSAWAAVSGFSKLEICFDTLRFERTDGTLEEENGSPDISVSPGLVSFSPTSPDSMSLGALNLTSNTTLKDVKLTIAVVPSVCRGANYSIRFNSGSGPDIDLTQNLAFEFDFPVSGREIKGGAQTITLYLGQIVNGLVSLANAGNLNNSTVQTVNIGKAD